MKVDKRNGSMCYSDETHTYWDENDNDRYTSVTTLIGKFKQEFEGEFWAAYKALEKILSPDTFKMEKGKMMDTHKVDLEYLTSTYNFDINEFNRIQQGILDEWQKNCQESCERGTKIHADLENKFYGGKAVKLPQYGFGGKMFKCGGEGYYNLDLDQGVYPEYFIYNNEHKLSGQIDLLIKDGNDIYIVDYKSNKKLDEKSYYDRRTKRSTMMKYPMSNLMDCNMNHYTLQLSTYAWMLQQINPEFVVKKLMIIHYDHKGNVSNHDIEYLKQDVERMIKYNERLVKLENSKAKRAPILY